MLTWEFSVLDFIQTHLRSSTGDIIMPLISRLGDSGVVWIVLALVLLIYPKTRKTGGCKKTAAEQERPPEKGRSLHCS